MPHLYAVYGLALRDLQVARNRLLACLAKLGRFKAIGKPELDGTDALHQLTSDRLQLA